MPEATLTSNVPGGEGLRVLTFGHVPEGYTRPGQFVTATVGEHKAGFFALASSPGEPVMPVSYTHLTLPTNREV